MKFKNAFTLVEALVIIPIILILLLIAVMSLNGIQARGRDAKRINDIVNLQQAMTAVSEENDNYQAACGGDNFQGLVSQCTGGGDDYQVEKYLTSVANLNDPSEIEKRCDQTCSNFPCNYTFQFIEKENYEVRFWLEKAGGDYKKGCHKLTAKGIE